MGQRCSKETGNVKGNGTGIDGSNNFVDATGEIPRGTELKRTKDTDYEERRPKEDSFDSRRSKLMHRDSLRLGACKMSKRFRRPVRKLQGTTYGAGIDSQDGHGQFAEARNVWRRRRMPIGIPYCPDASDRWLVGPLSGN
jgi:hypothetical protein